VTDRQAAGPPDPDMAAPADDAAARADSARPAGTAGPPETARPAYYAARPGPWRDWWTLLHPPYTAWHLSYVVIGACLAPRVLLTPLLAALAAFFLAVGVAAHALDELHGRPLRTRIPAPALLTVSAAGLAGAVALGIVGLIRVGWPLVPFLVVGPLLVIAYNAEWLHGIVHNDLGFAAAWGAFPVLTAYVGETGRLAVAPVLAAGAALGLSAAQRGLSTPARMLRRRSTSVTGQVTLADGQVIELDRGRLLAPLEQALRVMSWSVVLLAAALAIARLG
jgi:hypothetical protein